MNNIHIGVAGYFKIEAIKVDGEGNEISRRVAADWFPNLILNQGLDRMADNNDFMSSVQVGSGSTAPADTDTQLQSHIAGVGSITSNTYGAQSSAPYYGWRRNTWRFTAGTATGNLSEIGVGWSATGATLFSRSLIKDEEGNPTTITVLADEILDVTYELRNYPFLTDLPGSFDIGATTYTTSMRAANVTSEYGIFTGGWGVNTRGPMSQNPAYLPCVLYAGATMGAITDMPTGATSTLSGLWDSQSTYVPGTYTRTATCKWPVSSAITNVSHISFALGGCTTQMSLSPATLSKTTAQELKITVTLTWGRYTP